MRFSPVVQRRSGAGYRDTEVVEGDRGISALVAQTRRDRATMQDERRFDEPRDAGGWLEVPDVGLGRTDQQGGCLVATAEHGANSVRLDRVADGRAGAVRLDIRESLRIDAGTVDGGAQHRDLRVEARLGDRAGSAILIDGRRLYHCVDAVACGQRIVESPQKHDSRALATHEAVGIGVEGADAAGAREHVRAAERHVPSARLRQAISSATSDDEQAVSTPRLGPDRSSRFEMRLATIESAVPVPAWMSPMPLR